MLDRSLIPPAAMLLQTLRKPGQTETDTCSTVTSATRLTRRVPWLCAPFSQKVCLFRLLFKPCTVSRSKSRCRCGAVEHGSSRTWPPCEFGGARLPSDGCAMADLFSARPLAGSKEWELASGGDGVTLLDGRAHHLRKKHGLPRSTFWGTPRLSTVPLHGAVPLRYPAGAPLQPSCTDSETALRADAVTVPTCGRGVGPTMCRFSGDGTRHRR
jgi:hypothetical protein